jgi:hypothetical protein
VKLSAPSLTSEDTLGASEAEPSAPVRLAGFSPALPSAVEETYSGGLLSPEDDVGVGSLTMVQQEDEVGVGSLSEEAAPSLTKSFAPQTRLEAPELSDDGLLVQVKQIGDAVDGSIQGTDSESKWVSVLESPLHGAGLELEGSASGVEPTLLAVILAEESGLPLSVVVPIDASDGSSQMPAPGFSVPIADEFFGFLPAGSLSKDWEDFYSLPIDRVGMTDSEIYRGGFRSSLGGGCAGEPIMQGRRGFLLWGGDQPSGTPFCPGEKFASTWFPWPESCLSLSGGVEGGLAGDQGEGAYYGGWVLLCRYYLCAGDTAGDPSLLCRRISRVFSPLLLLPCLRRRSARLSSVMT